MAKEVEIFEKKFEECCPFSRTSSYKRVEPRRTVHMIHALRYHADMETFPARNEHEFG
jgi:hypothetical protein